MVSSRVLALATAISLLPLSTAAQNGDNKNESQPALPEDAVVPPAPVLSPEQALASFALQPGFQIECIASEPLIHDPVQVAFDAHGALWVVEMRGYMPDADGNGERDPVGRVSILHDDDGDGIMDRSETWLDDVVLPRAVLPLGEGRGIRAALTIEPPRILYREDRDGDGKPDAEHVLYSGVTAGLDNPEHAANSPVYGIDGWIHFSNHHEAYRFDGTRWHTRAEPVRGQWGLSQDDVGRLYFNYNSDYLRADLLTGPHWALGNRTSGRAQGINAQIDRDQRVFPIRPTPGVNRGYRKGLLDVDLKLTRFTATCSPFVLRSDTLGRESHGDVFVCEPAANAVRRSRITEKDGRMRGHNAYPEAEFLASTDERFRPVHLESGPDGALYVVDLYRGILQHKKFMTSFLRKQVEDRGLDKPIGLGRIYRVTAAGESSGVADASADAARTRRLDRVQLANLKGLPLVARLRDTNGFVRTTAQRLLVEQGQQSAEVMSALLALAHGEDVRESTSMHALSALAAFSVPAALDAQLLAALATSRDRPQLTAFALRLSAEGSDPRYHQSLVLFDAIVGLAADAQPAPVRWQLAPVLAEMFVASNSATRFKTLSALADCLSQGGGDSISASLAACHLGDFELEVLRHLLQLEAAPLPGVQALFAAVIKRGNQEEITTLWDLAKDPKLQPIRHALDKLLAKAPKPAPKQAAEVDPELAASAARGKASYIFCSACHQLDGSGLTGLAPPLAGSRWVTGDKGRLIRITTHGVQGKIQVHDTEWNLLMPAPPQLDSSSTADLLTYLRNSWGNQGSRVTPEEVTAERAKHKDRKQPWTVEELQRD